MKWFVLMISSEGHMMAYGQYSSEGTAVAAKHKIENLPAFHDYKGIVLRMMSKTHHTLSANWQRNAAEADRKAKMQQDQEVSE
jgi:hypothetical protein